MALGFVAPTSGHILYRGQDISDNGQNGFREFRRNVQAVFQNPYETFNPVYRIAHPEARASFARIVAAIARGPRDD